MTVLLFILRLFALGLLASAKEKLCDWPSNAKSEAAYEDARHNIHGWIEKGYYVEVLIGTPPQSVNVIIDTGSSNFAVASKPHEFVTKIFNAKESTSLQDTKGLTVDVKYTEGFWTGKVITDVVTVPSANVTTPSRADIVEIADSKNFFINGSGWQGILGLAYSELIQPSDKNIKSFMHSVVRDTGVSDVFSLQLCMADVHNYSDAVSGSFVIGGYHRNSCDIYWTKLVRKWYFEVVVLGMQVGNTSVAVPCSSFNSDKSIVDSGTTNLRLPNEVFNEVVFLLKNYVSPVIPDTNDYDAFWQGSEVLCWNSTSDPYQLFPALTIYLPSNEPNHTIALKIHPEHYILFIKHESEKKKEFCCKFGVSPSTQGTVLGAVLMEQYIVVFDRAEGKVGFSVSDCSPTSSIEHFVGFPNNTVCSHPGKKSSSITVILYVFIGVFLLFILPFCIIYFLLRRKRVRTSSDMSGLLDVST